MIQDSQPSVPASRRGAPDAPAFNASPASRARHNGSAGSADPKLDHRGIPDVQGRGDVRGIHLQRAGITGLRYPATAIDPEGVERPTIVELEMSVEVPAESKGTHMSRFVQLIQDDERALGAESIVRIAGAMRERLEARTGRIDVRYPLFFERAAPVSGEKGMVDVQCGLTVEITDDGIDLVETVAVTVTSLCPCSRDISDYGAHNQRGILTLEVRTGRDEHGQPRTVPVGELIHAAEESASCRVYPVLKRPDERWVTMEAYENPVFVEDMVRGTAERLIADERVEWFRVHARNLESIHGHDAFAQTEWSRGD